jgi:hypothetical protein
MANTCEPLINVVIDTEPKMLTGLAVVGSGVPSSSDAALHDHRRRGGAYPIPGTHVERGKPDTLPLGKRVARHADRVAGKGRGRKRTPACNGRDRGCAERQYHPTRKRADFPLVFRHERT